MNLSMKEITACLDLSSRVFFPLEKYSYTILRPLNNQNRWHTKKVFCVLNKNEQQCVSLSYSAFGDYLRFIETVSFLKNNNIFFPEIIEIYPTHNTIVCEYQGELLSDYLLENTTNICLSLGSIFDYLGVLNLINQRTDIFEIPSIVRESLKLSEELDTDFEFLPKVKAVLPQLEDLGVKFLYGCGIEDPHIWNFRIINNAEKIRAFTPLDPESSDSQTGAEVRNLSKSTDKSPAFQCRDLTGFTTDFDYFSNKVNCFWELGYLYATFRWFRKASLFLSARAETMLLSLVDKQDLKAQFMFWLGALSSYCGYRDSFRNQVLNREFNELHSQSQIIAKLDDRVSYLAKSISSSYKRSHIVV